ncbi:ATP-dependent NAD(P)H-hydrate dehydratase [Giardia duodenalis]|uniref:ATP-dependent (S)-NAD(P)H-hydrate dehydratase n=1 Tax=Giardia intestinalis (strain ATCC 50803 / WB clone C6) TaxID=184922 RepID=A8BHA1_GIAIC|nr:ATP-dependent NAD(P)H-hydrate dehydratase [Giardia intestinalis]KAE8301677.1 ATP-dependent NAD(P)H-hydrate dehydratase [Giardia intestinalis]|eukprot:XP_001707070.1 Sugar kinase, putative [Giardia lamblia ATCC 50803]
MQRLRYTLHKGQRGRPLLIAGSPKYHGAPILAGLSCLRAGADYCYLLVRGSNSQIVASASPNFIVSSCLDTWKDIHYTNILIGPGLDTEEESVALFTDVMSTKPSRLLLDADAIRIVCMLLKQQDVVTSGLLNQLSAAQSIITPNYAEFKHLYHSVFNSYPSQYEKTISVLGKSLTSNWSGIALGFIALKGLVKRGRKYYNALTNEPTQLSKKLGVVILIKGVVDVVVSPNPCDAARVVTERGQPKRSAGQGDILAGILAALLARSVDESALSICERAAILTRRASRAAYKHYGESMVASDVIAYINMSDRNTIGILVDTFHVLGTSGILAICLACLFTALLYAHV